MKKLILLIFILGFGLSCDRFPDPSLDYIKNYSFAFTTETGRKFAAGDWVTDTIKFRAVNNNNPMKDSVKVLFDIVTGDGQLTVQSAYTNKKGLAYTRWKLGTASCEQILRANTYDLYGNYLTSTDLSEYGFLDDQWNKYKGSPEGYMSDLVADTINKVTYMLSNSSLYRQSDPYYNWEIVDDPVAKSLRTIDIDSNGIMYAGTWNGELLRSNDHGETWITCAKPYPDRPYYMYVTVSNDNYIWVFAWDHRTRYSSDGGNSWQDAGGDASLLGYGNYYRLKDGSILFNALTSCQLFRSFDEGVTWTRIETPGLPVAMYVNKDENIFIITQGTLAIYSSTDFGATFTWIRNINPEWINTEFNFRFYKQANFYYVFIPGYGVLKTTNLSDSNKYEDYYFNTDLNNLFIDHNGNLMAKGWTGNTLYYRRKPSK
jgi:hypothetical protein